MNSVLSGLLSTGFAAGVWLVVLGLRGTTTTSSRPKRRLNRQAVLRLALCLLAAGLVMAITGWFAAAVLAGLGVALLPRAMRTSAEQRARLARIEAIATWTEMLRDTLIAAAGLEHAVLTTATRVPEVIRPEISALAARLRGGERLAVGLRHLGEELDDPTADLVIAALVLASEHQARHLAELLGDLATEAREQASMRMRIDAGRQQTRTSLRVIVITTIAFVTGLTLFNGAYLAPYDSITGQVVLAVVGGMFGLAFAWLIRIARLPEPARLLTEVPR